MGWGKKGADGKGRGSLGEGGDEIPLHAPPP